MFARVITAQAGTEGFDGTVALAGQQLPVARQQPGFKGYYLLTDAESGQVVIISLWETREQMDAVTAGAGSSGIRDEGISATGLSALHLETYEVPVHTCAMGFGVRAETRTLRPDRRRATSANTGRQPYAIGPGSAHIRPGRESKLRYLCKPLTCEFKGGAEGI